MYVIFQIIPESHTEPQAPKLPPTPKGKVGTLD